MECLRNSLGQGDIPHRSELPEFRKCFGTVWLSARSIGHGCWTEDQFEVCSWWVNSSGFYVGISFTSSFTLGDHWSPKRRRFWSTRGTWKGIDWQGPFNTQPFLSSCRHWPRVILFSSCHGHACRLKWLGSRPLAPILFSEASKCVLIFQHNHVLVLRYFDTPIGGLSSLNLKGRGEQMLVFDFLEMTPSLYLCGTCDSDASPALRCRENRLVRVNKCHRRCVGCWD